MSWYEVLKKHDATVDRLLSERDDALLRCRMAAATLINEIGASGPEVLGVTASRAVAEIEKLRRERDEARASASDVLDSRAMVVEELDQARAEVERLEVEKRDACIEEIENDARSFHAMGRILEEVLNGCDDEVRGLKQIIEDWKEAEATVDRLTKERDYAVAESLELLRTHREQSAAREAEVERLRAIILEEQGKARIAVNAVAVVSERALAEVERLRECLKVAGLQAFLRDRPQEEVADHLRRVIGSYDDAATRAEAEVKRLRGLIAEGLMSADCEWENRNEGHDWADWCKAARVAIVGGEEP